MALQNPNDVFEQITPIVDSQIQAARQPSRKAGTGSPRTECRGSKVPI